MAAIIFTILCLLLSLSKIVMILRFIVQGFIDREARLPFTRFCIALTEPMIAPLRSLIPPVGMFDMSMLVAIIMIQVMQLFTIRAGGQSLLPL